MLQKSLELQISTGINVSCESVHQIFLEWVSTVEEVVHSTPPLDCGGVETCS